MSEASDDLIPPRVERAERVADDIQLYELRRPDGGELPAFTPGAHLLVKPPKGLIRRYSVANAPEERDRHVLAVKREANGRGGSISLVDGTKPGDSIEVSAPRNDFELSGNPASYLFIAGGIGITPIRSMIHHLRNSGGKPYKLYYLSRTPEVTAFRDEFTSAEYRGKANVHHDVDGNVVEMASEPPESRMVEKVKHTAYPTREAAGFVWVYMGPPDEMPEFKPPAFAPSARPMSASSRFAAPATGRRSSRVPSTPRTARACIRPTFLPGAPSRRRQPVACGHARRPTSRPASRCSHGLRVPLRGDPAADQELADPRLRADHRVRCTDDRADPAEQRVQPRERERARGRHAHHVLFIAWSEGPGLDKEDIGVTRTQGAATAAD